MCLFCISKERLTNDELNGKYGAAYSNFTNYTDTKYDISLCQAPCSEPLTWCAAMACLCPAQIYTRHRVLNHINPGSGWKDYKCCQGVYGTICCCFEPGSMGESTCPLPCMCLEACICPGPAISASSHVIRNQYSLGLDDDDVRLIRCSNMLWYLSICLRCISSFTDCEGDDIAAGIVDLASDILFCCVAGCMTAQVNHEIKLKEKSAPSMNIMNRE